MAHAAAPVYGSSVSVKARQAGMSSTTFWSRSSRAGVRGWRIEVVPPSGEEAAAGSARADASASVPGTYDRLLHWLQEAETEEDLRDALAACDAAREAGAVPERTWRYLTETIGQAAARRVLSVAQEHPDWTHQMIAATGLPLGHGEAASGRCRALGARPRARAHVCIIEGCPLRAVELESVGLDICGTAPLALCWFHAQHDAPAEPASLARYADD
jgi:hypothetical protein